MQWFVDVILPLPLNSCFTYALPETLAGNVQVGCRVVVPFGKKKFYTGIVQDIHCREPEGYEVKDVADVLDARPVLLASQFKLWDWVADYYLCTRGDVYKAALPSGLKLESETIVAFNPDFEPSGRLSDREQKVLSQLESEGETSVTCLEKSPEAFQYLERNAASALPGFDAARPAVTCVRGDVFEYQRQLAPESLDLILSNPPYVTDEEMERLDPEVRREPAMALRADREGLAFYEHIAPAYLPALRPGGWLAVEIGWKQGAAVQAIFRAAGYEAVTCIPDLEGRDRVVAGKKP